MIILLFCTKKNFTTNTQMNNDGTQHYYLMIIFVKEFLKYLVVYIGA